jgi:hypothetical protein
MRAGGRTYVVRSCRRTASRGDECAAGVGDRDGGAGGPVGLAGDDDGTGEVALSTTTSRSSTWTYGFQRRAVASPASMTEASGPSRS